MLKPIITCVVGCLFLFLWGCHSLTKTEFLSSTQQTIRASHKAGFSEKRTLTSTFNITTFQRFTSSPVKTIHAYIEGDGNSWKSKFKLSKNPTPKQPLALMLANQDPFPDVVYLARPCQYTPLEEDPYCNAKYWSSHRYAPEVIAAMNSALDQIKANANASDAHFVLIGFSGGASIAALLAAERNDVQGLITVAGDLDHEKLNQHHQVTPLSGSLNPRKIAPKLKKIPQQHWVGNKDRVVPTFIAKAFTDEVGDPACAKFYIVNDVGHHQGWAKHWSQILQKPLVCSDNPPKA